METYISKRLIITEEVAYWLYTNMYDLMGKEEGMKSCLMLLSRAFHNSDNENFTIILERQDEVDGIVYFGVYHTAWYWVDKFSPKGYYDDGLLFHLREDMDITEIEKKLMLYDIDTF